MRRRALLAVSILAATAAGVGAEAQPVQPSSPVAPAATTPAPPAGIQPTPGGTAATGDGARTAVDPHAYRIGAEDILQVSVWKNDAMSRTVPVRPDGKITLPLLNDVEVAGLTPMELREVLIGKIQEYMPAPEVSVIVVEPRSFKVSVMGEVARPGRYELRTRATVLDLIALAGGLNQFAARGKIVVLRPDPKGVQQRLSFNYNKAISAGGEQENFYLLPGDIIVIP